MRAACVVALAALAGSASAFVVPGAIRQQRSVAVKMAASPSDDISALAASCLEDGCSVDMVDELVASLKVKRSALIMQTAGVDDLLRQLEGASGGKAGGGGINDIVASVARLFSKGDDDYPSLGFPTGYSGDTNKGNKDAWDYKISKK